VLAPVFIAALAVAAPAPTAVTPEAEARLQALLGTILTSPDLGDADVGVHVRSLSDGRTLFSRNATKLMNPASNMKLLTTASALWFLGPNYRFRTEARRDAELEGGVVKGNLYVKGGGDPTLTSEEVFGFVNEIALRGVREVKGDLVVDDTFFDRVFEGPGWDQEIGDHAYAAPIGALSFNFNTFEVHVTPGDRVGDPVHVAVWPDVPSIEVTASAFTRGSGSRGRIWTGTSRQPGDRIRVTVRGTMAANDVYGRINRSRVHNPSLFAGEMLMRMLEHARHQGEGQVALRQRCRSGARCRWPPCTCRARWRHRQHAQQVLEQLHGRADLEDARGRALRGPGHLGHRRNRACGDFLAEVGMTRDKVRAGQRLRAQRRQPRHPRAAHPRSSRPCTSRFDVQPEYVASLAVAGASGTIHSRFADTPAEARLRAKTGSLTGVSALSGYVETQDDDVLAFSVMMNGYSGRTRSMWKVQDQIGAALADFRAAEAIARP
jgi:D-alanyl-D-alanine carboxypeptidase/D-alanyl-D-alanine-endopeptidase (penicillin-binding protein 4)